MEQTDKKISQMPPLQTVSGDEIVPVVKSGGNYSTLVSQIVALARQTMVEAQAGKGLSANDFTDAFKAKLEGLSNYDDTQVRALIAAVNGRLDTILGDGASTAIDTFNEIEAFLSGITDTQTLTGLLAEQKQTITAETDTKLAGKVDKVIGKGLSANDFTNDEKAKLSALPTKAELDSSLGAKLDKSEWDEEHGQFGLSGYISPNFTVVQNTNFKRSGLLPLDRNSDIVATVAGTNIAAIALYDAAGEGIAYKSAKYDSSSYPMTWPSEEFPDNAIFFQVSTIIRDGINYTNGPTQEAREGAMAEALASLGRDKLDKSKWDAKHGQYTIKGRYLSKWGIVREASSENSAVTPLLPLNKTYPIVLKNVIAYNAAVAVCFYDAAGLFISYPEGIEDLNGDFTVTVDKYPADACYFRACTEKAGSTYTNGPTQEAREGAVSEAIQASKLALFIDLWDAAWTKEGKYDPQNAPDSQHPFMGNGLWFTFAEALRIYDSWLKVGKSAMKGAYTGNIQVHRTVIPPAQSYNLLDMSQCFNDAINLEVFVTRLCTIGKLDYAFKGCTKLTTVKIHTLGYLRSAENCFAGCSSLTTVELSKLCISISFADSPLLSLSSMQYLVSNAANTTEITVTVHPDVYAKLTDESNAEWHTVLTDAEAKQITFATTN